MTIFPTVTTAGLNLHFYIMQHTLVVAAYKTWLLSQQQPHDSTIAQERREGIGDQ